MPLQYIEWVEQLQEYRQKVWNTDTPDDHGWGRYIPSYNPLPPPTDSDGQHADWKAEWEDEDYILPPSPPDSDDFPTLGEPAKTVPNHNKPSAAKTVTTTGQRGKQRKKFVKLDEFDEQSSITKDQTCVGEITTGLEAVTLSKKGNTIARAVPVYGGTQNLLQVFDCKDKKTGDTTPAGMQFCPLLAVAQFATKYVRESFSERIEAAFFADGKIWTRQWDLYYIWHSYWYTPCPIIFVPVTQVASLIQEINAAFPDLQWKATKYDDARGLRVGFFERHEEFRPRWLGESRSKADFETMRDSVESPIACVPGGPSNNYFAMSMRLSIDGAAHLETQYREVPEKWKHLHSIEAFEADRERLRAYFNSPQQLEDPVLLIAIDCEAFECDKGQTKRTTEVGVATLDIRDVLGTDPGLAGANWHKHVRARHFLIRERRHLKNFRFVAGHPDKFQYGKTEVVPLDQAASWVESCFCEPYSAGDSYLGYDASKRRRVVLVGHDIRGDLSMVSSLGFSWDDRPYIVDTIDTVELGTCLEFDRLRKPKLTKLVHRCGFPTPYAHNAGNDAVFTMWALLGFAANKNTNWFP